MKIRLLSFTLLTVLLFNCSSGYEKAEEWDKLNNKAMYYFEQEKLSSGLKVAERAVEIAERNFPSDHPNIATSYNTYALFLFYTNNIDGEAEKLLKKAISIRENKFGFDSEEVIESLKLLSKIYADKKKFDEAIKIFRRVIVAEEKNIGVNHPYHAATLEDFADLYMNQKKYPEAEKYYKEALNIYTNRYGGNDTLFVGNILNKLNRLYEIVGETEKAESLIKRQRKNLTDEKILTDLRTKVRKYTSESNYLEAIKYSKEALKITQKIYGKNSLSVGVDFKNLANLYKIVGESAKAKFFYEKALDIWIKERGPSHPGVIFLKNELDRLDGDG